MTLRAPWWQYALAAVTGLIPGFVFLSAMFADPATGKGLAREMTERGLAVAFLYLVTGGAWGAVKPGPGWRWGAWVALPALLFLGLLTLILVGQLVAGGSPPPIGEILVLPAFAAATLGAAALGAWAAASIRQKRA